MLQLNKIRTILITLLVIISSFSVLLYSPHTKADDTFDEIPSDLSLESLMELLRIFSAGIEFENILTPHPYRYVGVWQPNSSYNINGDMDFELFVSSTLMDYINFFDLDFQDKIDVSLYHIDGNNTPKKIKEEKGAKLNVGSLDMENKIRSLSVKMKNLEIELDSKDYLLFGIEVNQTKKPISTFSGKRLIPVIEKLFNLFLESEMFADLLKENDLIEDEGDIDYIADQLSNITKFIGEDEIESIVNTIVSSAFYYGSKSYDSNVKFSSESGKNFTIYFRKEANIEFESKFYVESLLNEYIIGFFKIANQTAPHTEEHRSWPPRYLIENLLEEAGTYDSSTDLSQIEDDALNWVILWVLYTFEGRYKDITNAKYLYLKDNGEMTANLPKGKLIREKLSNTSLKWTSPSFERNKILKNVSAELYIHYPKIIPIGDIEITAKLFDNDKKLDTNTKIIDGATFSELVNRGPETPTTFNFEIENYEITYDHSLKLEVSLSKSSFFNLRPIYLLYNSDDYPSHLKYVYDETENIKIEEISPKNVYSGGSANFDIEISSNFSDTLDINIEEKISEGPWDISWTPKKINVDKDSNTIVTVSVKSDATDETAYGNDYITLYFNVSGKTGIDSKTETIRVDKTKVEYDLELILPDKKFEVKHGENKTFEFKIRNKNTGFLTDSYGVAISSENEFYSGYEPTEKVSVYTSSSKNEATARVRVDIPLYTDVESDRLILKIISSASSENLDEPYNETYNIEIDIITPNIFESTYHLFEQLSNKIGLDDALEDQDLLKGMGAWILIFIAAIILLIIVTIIILIIRRKYVEIICLKRIKEIKADEKAVFEVTIKNPYKKTLIYNIKANINKEIKKRWDVKLEKEQITITSGKSEKIKLTVEPTDNVKPEDWAKITVTAKPIDKRKSIKIDTITVVKDSKIDVSISGVLHWPKIFKKGDRIETSFKLFNRGDVSAEKITVMLYVNGKLKNKAENVTIPVGGHADIEIPWIAEKGKNEIEIIVK